MIKWKINWVLPFFFSVAPLGFCLWFLSWFLFFFTENWMSFEDFLQHCTAKHRSYRSNHRQGGAVHWMLDGDCGFAEDGKITRAHREQRESHYFSPWRRPSKVQFTITIRITSMTCTPTSTAATEAEWTPATSVMEALEETAVVVAAAAEHASTEVCNLRIKKNESRQHFAIQQQPRAAVASMIAGATAEVSTTVVEMATWTVAAQATAAAMAACATTSIHGHTTATTATARWWAAADRWTTLG